MSHVSSELSTNLQSTIYIEREGSEASFTSQCIDDRETKKKWHLKMSNEMKAICVKLKQLYWLR